MRIFTPLLLTVLLTSACNADEAAIKTNLEARFPGAKVNSVATTPMKGIYEVVVDGDQIIYTDAQADYVMVGNLLETKTRRSLTEERMDKLSEVKFDTLPLDQAIPVVRGDGKRKFAVFSDPDCPYCRRLEMELEKLDNVTMYIFPYPLAMHPEAARKSRQVWCSADRAKAWRAMMLEGKDPTGREDCANPVDANVALGQKLNINGTPAIILSNGRRVAGLVPADRLEGMLTNAAK